MTAVKLPTGVEFDSCAQWKYRVLTQLLWKLERVFHPGPFEPLKMHEGTTWWIGQMASQIGSDSWTFRVSWPGHEFEIYAQEFDR